MSVRLVRLATLVAACTTACANPPQPVDPPTPVITAAPPPPSRLNAREGGKARLFYFERYEDNFLTRRIMAEAPALANQWQELVDVRRQLREYRRAQGELGSTLTIDRREALEWFPSPEDELALASGRTTVILESTPAGGKFTPEDEAALQARLARFEGVRVALWEELAPPAALLARERAVEGDFDHDELQQRLARAAREASIEDWEGYLGERLHVGDLIDYEPSAYRGVYVLIVGERPGRAGEREAYTLVPFHGGEFYVTPPAYLTCPDRVPFGYWSDPQAAARVDCFPVQHAWLRAHTIGGRVQIDGVTYPIPPAVSLLLEDDHDGGFQVYACPGAQELWTFERRSTWGER